MSWLFSANHNTAAGNGSLIWGGHSVAADLKVEVDDESAKERLSNVCRPRLDWQSEDGCRLLNLLLTCSASTSRCGLWISHLPRVSDFSHQRENCISHFLYFDLYQGHDGSRAGWSWMETNPIWQSFQIGKQLKYRGPTFRLTSGEYLLPVWRAKLRTRCLFYWGRRIKEASGEEQIIWSRKNYLMWKNIDYLRNLELSKLFVSSDRSSYSDVVPLYIHGDNFFRFSLSPLMQLMLQVSL